jgi:hypothetical protein
VAVKLNKKGYDNARKLIKQGHFVKDERDAWSEHSPSAQKQNEFIERHGYKEYEKWFLEIDDGKKEGTKGRYKFPYGDFKDVHRCAVISSESRAGQYKHFEIEEADAHLLGMIDSERKAA